MYIKIFAKDDAEIGQVDLTGTFLRGFALRLTNTRGQSDRVLERDLQRLINVGLAHERDLQEAVEVSLVEILKLIAAEAVQPPDELADGSTDFHVTQARIDEARAAIAASEAP